MINETRKWSCVLGVSCALVASASASAGGLLQGGSGAKAQVETRESETAEAVRVEHAPKLDGTLDDPLWQSAKPIRDFRQQEPFEGQPATERTEVRILYTRHAVFFGIRCLDSQPSRIIASELRRDVSQDLDDHFEILIDSNHDRRGAYVFQVNPLGTQIDGLIVEEQRDSSSTDFDSGWRLASRCTVQSGSLPRQVPRFARVLFDRASRVLVLAKADELRMSQPISFGPFHEFNLSDGFWPQPNCLLHFLSVQFFAKTCSLRLRQIHEWAGRRHEMF